MDLRVNKRIINIAPTPGTGNVTRNSKKYTVLEQNRITDSSEL